MQNKDIYVANLKTKKGEITMIFKKEKKEELLQGRKIRHICKDLECTEVHLYNVLNGINKCSKYLARDIVSKLRPDKKIEDYFDKK